MIPRILALTVFDAHTISALAETVWRHHYADIISPEQIDYMLAQRYQPELLKEQVLNPEIWWRKLVLDGMIIGFSCCMRTHKPGELKIDNCIFMAIISAKAMVRCWWQMLLKSCEKTIYNH